MASARSFSDSAGLTRSPSCARSTTTRSPTRTGERFVSDHANDHFAALCPTIVLDDADEAFKIGTRGQRFFAEAIHHWYGTGYRRRSRSDDGDSVEAMHATPSTRRPPLTR